MKSQKDLINFVRKAGFVIWFFAGALALKSTVRFVRAHDEDIRISKIAQHFNCICKMNCGLKVSECDCKEPGGATEIKEAIRRSIKQGMTDEVITSLLIKNGAMKIL